MLPILLNYLDTLFNKKGCIGRILRCPSIVTPYNFLLNSTYNVELPLITCSYYKIKRYTPLQKSCDVPTSLKKSPICFKRKRKAMVLSFVIERSRSSGLRYFTYNVSRPSTPLVTNIFLSVSKEVVPETYSLTNNLTKPMLVGTVGVIRLKRKPDLSRTALNRSASRLPIVKSYLSGAYRSAAALKEKTTLPQVAFFAKLRYLVFYTVYRKKNLRKLLAGGYLRRKKLSGRFLKKVALIRYSFIKRLRKKPLLRTKFKAKKPFLNSIIKDSRLLKFYLSGKNVKSFVKLPKLLAFLSYRKLPRNFSRFKVLPIKRFLRVSAEYSNLRILIENRRGTPLFVFDAFKKLPIRYKEYRSALRELVKFYNKLSVYAGFFRIKNFYNRKKVKPRYLKNFTLTDKASRWSWKLPTRLKEKLRYPFFHYPFNRKRYYKRKVFRKRWLLHNFRTHRQNSYGFVKSARTSTRSGLGSLFFANPLLFLLRSFTIVMPRNGNSRKFTRVLSGVINSLLLLNRAMALTSKYPLSNTSAVITNPLYKRPAFWWGTTPYKKRRRKKRTRRKKSRGSSLYRTLPPIL